MLDVLKKKAIGFEITETTAEYAVDEEGNRKIVKEKCATKYVPPDLAAIKAYMEIKDGELYSMSDEELKNERNRLINALNKENKGEV